MKTTETSSCNYLRGKLPVFLLRLLFSVDGDDNSVIFAGNQTPILFASLGPASSRDVLVMTFSETLTLLLQSLLSLCCSLIHIITNYIETNIYICHRDVMAKFVLVITTSFQSY